VKDKMNNNKFKLYVQHLVGKTIRRDGYDFVINEVHPHRDENIRATVILCGSGGSIEIGYFDLPTDFRSEMIYQFNGVYQLKSKLNNMNSYGEIT
jgi:hypothetical protein